MKVTVTMEFDSLEEALEILKATPTRTPLEEPVDVLGLSVRARNILALDLPNVKTVADLVAVGRDGMHRTRNCGPTTIKEIAGKLRLIGVTW